MTRETQETGVIRIAITTIGPDHGSAEAVPVAVKQDPSPWRWCGLAIFNVLVLAVVRLRKQRRKPSAQ